MKGFRLLLLFSALFVILFLWAYFSWSRRNIGRIQGSYDLTIVDLHGQRIGGGIITISDVHPRIRWGARLPFLWMQADEEGITCSGHVDFTEDGVKLFNVLDRDYASAHVKKLIIDEVDYDGFAEFIFKPHQLHDKLMFTLNTSDMTRATLLDENFEADGGPIGTVLFRRM